MFNRTAPLIFANIVAKLLTIKKNALNMKLKKKQKLYSKISSFLDLIKKKFLWMKLAKIQLLFMLFIFLRQKHMIFFQLFLVFMQLNRDFMFG